MAGVTLELNVLGDTIVRRELVDRGLRGLDATPAFTDISHQLMASEKRRFSTRGFGTWADTTDTTKARKAASKNPKVRANAQKVLVATERLRDSLTKPGHDDMVLDITPQFMIYGTAVPYAEIHQQGHGVKVRKPVGLSENAKRHAVRTLQAFVVNGGVR